MSFTLPPGMATSAQLAPLADARALIAAGLAERADVIRTGERAPISRWIRTLVHKRDGWACTWCGDSPWANSEERRADLLNVDHITPWSAGGSDRTDNLRTLCDGCNRFRSNYVSDMHTYQAMPIVRICDPCGGVFTPTAERFDAYCASRHHLAFSTIEARIL